MGAAIEGHPSSFFASILRIMAWQLTGIGIPLRKYYGALVSWPRRLIALDVVAVVAEILGRHYPRNPVQRGEVNLSGHDAAGPPDRQTLSSIPPGTAPPFALASFLPSPKDKSKQKHGRDDHQRQNGAHRRAAVRRSVIGQGW